MAEYEKSVAFTTNVNQEPKGIGNIGSRAAGFVGGTVADLANRESLEYEKRGEARKFDANEYKISSHSYPIDLVSDDPRYGDNYVIFYINVSEDSKYVKLAEQQNNISADIPSGDRGDFVAQNYNTTQVAGAQALRGAGFGSLVGDSTGGGALGFGFGIVQGALVASESAGFTRPQKRLKTAIALHIPNTLNINYGMQWDEEGTFAFQALAEVGRIGGDVITSLVDSATSGTAKGLGSKILNDLKQGKSMVTATGLNLGGPALSGLSGLAANPKKEQIFKGVDFRTFTFDYQFYPRDEKEAQAVRDIISTFKYHMHPEFKDDGNWLYVYPSEFDIYYYHGEKENLNIHRHTSCVLTSMNVNYTPQGQFTTFHDGMPTQVNVTLTFKELALLTKDKIEDGM